MDKLTLDLLAFGYNTCLKYVRDIVRITEKLKCTNELVFIDFLDELNEISVKY